MRRTAATSDPIQKELHAILGVLQDLMILECVRDGIRREDLRLIVPVDNTRISRIMKHVKRAVKRVELPRIERPVIAPPPSRNSVELIEGNKRREVDMP